MNRWVEDDRTYRQSYRLAGYARRPGVRWTALFLAWVLVTAVLSAAHLAVLIWVVMAGLIWYGVSYVLRVTPRAGTAAASRQAIAGDGEPRFNPPPGWPEPPPGWTPPPGWEPNPAWPPAPPGWRFWVTPARHRASERRGRDRAGRYDRYDSADRYDRSDGTRRREPW